MEEDQKNALQRYYHKLVNSVQCHNVVTRLVSENVLTSNDALKISAAETNQERMMR